MSHKPVNKKRVIGHKEHLKGPFLEAYKEIGFIYASCEKVGLDATTVKRWRKVDLDFDQKCREANYKSTELLERVALTRAMKKSDLLMIFLLKALNPEKYKDRYSHELDTKTIDIIVTKFLGAIKKHSPDYCPHCKSHLGLPDKIAKELEGLSASLVTKR